MGRTHPNHNNMKKSVLLSLLIAATCSTHAAIENGKVYAIVPVTDTTKALFVANAATKAGTPINIWTNTHVPAQQWRAVKSANSNTYSFRNLYSGKYLTYSSSRPQGSGMSQEAALSDRTRFLMRAVDADNNVYRMRLANNTLQAPGTADGSLPVLATNDADNNMQEWRLVEVDHYYTDFCPEARNEMMAAFLKQFIQVHNGNLLSLSKGGWGEAEMMEVLLDAYEETRNDVYKTLFQKIYAYFKQGVGDYWDKGGQNGYDWFGYDFNDDVAWMVIASARAGHLFGDQVYIDDSKRNFDIIYKRCYVPQQGLLRWAEKSGVKDDGSFTINSCVNGPMEVAACYIAMNTGDESYYEKARDLYAQQRAKLANISTGQVYDCFRVNSDGIANGEGNHWASTYNQGTMMGAAVLLYNHYKDATYKQDAEQIMSYTANNMCDDGIIRVCQTVKGDLCGFKGILMRYVRRLIIDCGAMQYTSWMKANAWRVYNNRNSAGYTHSAWLTKSAESLTFGSDTYNDSPFGCSTAISAAFNTPLGTDAETSADTLHAVYEAELCTPTGVCTIARDAKASMGMYMGYVGNGNTLSFDYFAPQAGTYQLGIHYMTLEDRSMTVSLNGARVKALACPATGAWDASRQGMVTLDLSLIKGINTISVGNASAYCPNIDRFEITPDATVTGLGPHPAIAQNHANEKWYTLSGMSANPSQRLKGVYIHQGRKVTIR